MDALVGGVEAHGPAPEKTGAFGGGAAVHGLLHLTLAAEAADGQDGGAVHREEQHRAVEEHDAERVERVVEEVAVADRERRGPVQVWEDAERHRLAPGPHEDRADEAQHQVKPDDGGKGPEGVTAQAQLVGPPVAAIQPEEDRQRQAEPRQQPPAAFVQRHEQAQPVLRQRRLERQPEQVADEQHRVPVHRGQHVQPDDLKGDDAEENR